jgi:hypothetical protein
VYDAYDESIEQRTSCLHESWMWRRHSSKPRSNQRSAAMALVTHTEDPDTVRELSYSARTELREGKLAAIAACNAWFS